jgi:hypothetical protein
MFLKLFLSGYIGQKYFKNIFTFGNIHPCQSQNLSR